MNYILYAEVQGDLLYVGDDYMLENVYRIMGYEEQNVKYTLGLDVVHWMIFQCGQLVEQCWL